MIWAIQTNDLTKRFPSSLGRGKQEKSHVSEHPAVDRVNITIQKGELFGLLGPNGAGKTTLIKLLCTLIMPTSGTAKLFGYPLHNEAEIRKMISLVTSDERSFYWRLTGRQNLEFFANMNGLFGDEAADTIGKTLSHVGLLEVADQRFQTYSTGMRQRLAIGRAILNQPRLLFLDEPSRGLDPKATNDLHELITALVTDHGITVLITTHRMEEAEKLCDRIAIMDHGRILACGKIAEIKTSLESVQKLIFTVSNLKSSTQGQLLNKLRNIETNPIDELYITDGEIIISAQEITDPIINQTIDILRKEQINIQQIQPVTNSLETIFSQITSSFKETEILTDTGPENIISEQKKNRFKPIKPSMMFPNIIGLRIALAFLKRDWLIESSYRISFLLQFIGIFFSVTMFYFISILFDKSATAYLTRYNTDYFSFVLIGIAFSSYFGVGLSSFSRSLREAQTTGTLEAILTTSVKTSTLIFSSSLWEYLFTTFKVIIYLLIGVLFLRVRFENANYFSALVILILSIVSFSSLGIIAASFIMVLKRGDPVTWIVSSISSLLGGVYYPVNVLPGALQWLAKLIPITYTLDAVRLALLQGYSIPMLLSQIIALSIFCVLLIPISILAFRYGLQRAKIEGSLTHY